MGKSQVSISTVLNVRQAEPTRLAKPKAVEENQVLLIIANYVKHAGPIRLVKLKAVGKNQVLPATVVDVTAVELTGLAKPKAVGSNQVAARFVLLVGGATSKQPVRLEVAGWIKVLASISLCSALRKKWVSSGCL